MCFCWTCQSAICWWQCSACLLPSSQSFYRTSSLESLFVSASDTYKVTYLVFIWFLRYLTRMLIRHLSLPLDPQFILVLLWYHDRICTWNQPVLSNKGKISCSRKQPLMGLEPTTSVLRVNHDLCITSQTCNPLRHTALAFISLSVAYILLPYIRVLNMPDLYIQLCVQLVQKTVLKYIQVVTVWKAS